MYTHILKIYIYTWKRWGLYIKKSPPVINAHFLPPSANSHEMNAPEKKVSGGSE